MNAFYIAIAAFLLFIVALRVFLGLTDQYIIHFHWQNPSEKKPAQPLWRHGRCWWYLYPKDENKMNRYPSPTLNLDWLFFQKHLTQVGFDIAAEEEDFDFYLGISPLFSIHIVLAGIPIFYKLFHDSRSSSGYETSIRWSEGILSIHVVHDESWGVGTFDRWWIPHWIKVWTSTRYKDEGGVGFYISFLIDNLFLGRRLHDRVMLWTEPIQAEIPIEPDNSLGFHYFGTFMAERHIWRRQYFPWFKRVHHYVDIRVDDPPLHAGKGENSWDIDDDGIVGMGVPGTTLEEAISGYQDAVKRDREEYGRPGYLIEAQRRSLEL